MKLIKIILILFCAQLFAQKMYPIVVKDSIKEALIDDFDNLYLSRSNDFSIVKYDTIGHVRAQLRLPYPFKIQSVENPLNIFLFSENGQEIKILDQNLNEVQNINLYGKYGHLKATYVEDLQYAWLLDSSKKTLLQYNYRDDKVVKSFPLKIDFEQLVDFLVFENKIYVLKEKTFVVYGFNSEKYFAIDIDSGRKLRRENDKIYVMEKSLISLYLPNHDFLPVFSQQNYTIVEKNSNHFLALIADKFYLYPFEK